MWAERLRIDNDKGKHYSIYSFTHGYIGYSAMCAYLEQLRCYMFDNFFFFLFSCLCSVCFRNGLHLFVLLSLFYCITIIRSLLLYIPMDFSPPSEDSESLGKLQSIYILRKNSSKNNWTMLY